MIFWVPTATLVVGASLSILGHRQNFQTLENVGNLLTALGIVGELAAVVAFSCWWPHT